MSDLISRNYMRKWILDNPMANIHEMLDAVYDAPTAYDVDKVIDELEEYIFNKYCVERDEKVDEIIRAGGVNE